MNVAMQAEQSSPIVRRNRIIASIVIVLVATVPFLVVGSTVLCAADTVVDATFGKVAHAKCEKAMADMQALESELLLFAVNHHGRFPASLDELPLSSDDHKLLIDPWGRAYRYRAPHGHSAGSVSTFGRDGMPGGRGADTDLDVQVGGW